MNNEREIPIIGNNIRIYAGAITIGDITISDNVSIGSGTVLTIDILDNYTVVSNPLRIIIH